MPEIYRSPADLPEGFQLADLPARSGENHFALVSPAPGSPGEEASQSAGLQRVLESSGTPLTVLPAPEGGSAPFLRSLVLLGEDREGQRLCIPAQPAGQAPGPEVLRVAGFFRDQGYRISLIVPEGVAFAGGRDVLWHPGRRLLWGATGPGTAPAALEPLAAPLQAPLLTLELVDPAFSHLNSCLWPLNETTALVHAPAFAPASLELLRRGFASVVPISPREATDLALEGLVLPPRQAVLHKGSANVCELLRMLGFSVRELPVGSFLSRGGAISSLVLPYSA